MFYLYGLHPLCILLGHVPDPLSFIPAFNADPTTLVSDYSWPCHCIFFTLFLATILYHQTHFNSRSRQGPPVHNTKYYKGLRNSLIHAPPKWWNCMSSVSCTIKLNPLHMTDTFLFYIGAPQSVRLVPLLPLFLCHLYSKSNEKRINRSRCYPPEASRVQTNCENKP